jgi:hypothetical protein
MRITAMVLTGAIASTFLSASETAQNRIPIFVRSAQNAGGFTDPSKDREDSVKDLRKKLKDSDSVRPVESEKEALVMLEVLGREMKSEWGRGTNTYLTVRLTAGQYSAEFTGKSGSASGFTAYGDAAGKVVEQLEAWIKANRDQLLALKRQAAPAGAAGPETTPPTPKP